MPCGCSLFQYFIKLKIHPVQVPGDRHKKEISVCLTLYGSRAPQEFIEKGVVRLMGISFVEHARNCNEVPRINLSDYKRNTCSYIEKM